MAMQSPSSSSSISRGYKYQVFLSFRGIDTRYGFTGNLYKALTDKGIHTFIDDRELQGGDEITPSLLKAIEESRIFIPVFSINYATSKFCLDELVHIIHCYKTKGRLILPVFFGVDPTNVRHQTGSYGEALAEHEKRFQNDKDNMERLHQWKLALTQAANMSGYHSSHGYEYKFIEDIVKYISNKISRQPLHVANYPVGLQSRVQHVKSLLDEGSDDGVHMVGLYGTGGLGKSTLAKAIYNFISDQFECSCFLENVRENSASNKLKHLQEELLLKTLQLEIKFGGVSEGIPYIKERLHTKKILLILDDVDDMKQLHALAGGPDWFGRGSRVIITTRDKHLLRSHGIESTHEVKGLYGTEALELLRWMALKNNKVSSSYDDVLNRAVSYASGLPLVLEIVGSNLFGKRIEEWKGTLDGYEKVPNKKIHEMLKLSYDALEEEQQSVFLDSLSKKFQNMKVLILDKCEYLTHIPDVSGLQNLEKFSFENCKNLITIHNSIGLLNKLERLSAYGCSKLEHFPPLGLASLNVLNLSFCVSLKSFPILLCEMTNIKKIWLQSTSIRELPSSFQNLTELDDLLVWGESKTLRFSKQNDKMYSIVFAKVTKLTLGYCNLSDDCLQIVLKWCVNVKSLELSWNNFKLIPECLSECHLLNILRLDNCKSLKEIRGIPPNLETLSAKECISLSSSSRRMLLSQKLHEAGCNIRFPNSNDGIPDWFEHQSRGDTISFWFRKKIPSISFIILFPGCTGNPKADLFVNGYKCFPSGSSLFGSSHEILYSEHSYLFDVKLEEQIKHFNLMSEMDKALLKNEWIHVELKSKKLSSAQMGIHVRKEKSNAEENVIFTNPHRKYSNTSLSQFEPPLKKQRLVEVVVSETEIWQQQHLALLSLQQQMALLPQQQRITVLSGMWNLVLSETKQSTFKKKHAEEGASETEILQQ